MKDYEEWQIAEAIRQFGKHETTYASMGDFDILDFRRPDTIRFELHVIFDRKRCNRVYISGDLGEAVIYPTCPATLWGTAECFTSRKADGSISVNWSYFLEKVRATSDRWCWTSERFWEDFEARCEEEGLDGLDFIENHKEFYWDGAVDINTERGVTLSEAAKKELHEIDNDYSCWVYDCGRRVSPRVILWLVALRLAYEAVEAEKKGGAK